MRSDRAPLWLPLFAWGVLIGLHAPFVILAGHAFGFGGTGAEISGAEVNEAHGEGFSQSMLASFRLAAVSTSFSVILGSLIASAFAKGRESHRRFVSLLTLVPLALPALVSAVALLLTIRALSLTPGFAAVVLIHTTFCVGLVSNNVMSSFRSVPAPLVDASMDLGANWFQTFRHVIFPGIAPALLAAMLLVFVLSFGESVAVVVLAGNTEPLTLWILRQIEAGGTGRQTSAVVLVLALVPVIPVVVAWYFQRTRRGA